MRRRHIGSVETTDYFLGESAVDKYLNLPGIQSLLGVDPQRFGSHNKALGDAWRSQSDYELPTTRDISWLLENGVPLLSMSGEFDAQMCV